MTLFNHSALLKKCFCFWLYGTCNSVTFASFFSNFLLIWIIASGIKCNFELQVVYIRNNLRWFKSVQAVDSWFLDHVISNWQFLTVWEKKIILWIYSGLTTIILFLAWDKSHDSTANCLNRCRPTNAAICSWIHPKNLCMLLFILSNVYYSCYCHALTRNMQDTRNVRSRTPACIILVWFIRTCGLVPVVKG